MESGKKKTVIWNSNSPSLKTGLGRMTKAALEYLHKTNKYNVICYAMGMQWDHVEHNRFPYKIVGCLPNSQEEINQIINSQPPESREAASRALGYGQVYVDRVIKEFKPDVMFFSDDIWSFSGYIDKPWWNKFHTAFHLTIDSKPVLAEARKQAENTPHFFTWLDFATEWMHELGYNHIKTLCGAIDPTPFKKLNKIELRNHFNIPQNSTIFGFVFRNQIRKEVLPLLEAFKIFCDKHPEANPYLLLHTNFSEGWRLPEAIKEYKVDPAKVLTTYICRHCGEIEVKTFTKQDLDCKFCGAKGQPPSNENPNGGGQITCNVQCGCTEDQLNQVYNLMDFYIHLSNAGGLELPVVEALYTELPVATMDYAFGSTFVKQPFVTKVDHNKSYQIDTQFERAHPIIFSIYKTMRKFWEMKPEKRKEIGRQGREWALSKFHPSIIGKQLEDFIDSLPPVNYDYEFDKPVEKDPNAEIDFGIPHNDEWVEQVYNKILKRGSDQDGKKHWISVLERGESRQNVVSYFRQVAAQENAKAKPITLSDVFGNTKKEERVLFSIPETLGDCIYATGLLTNLRSLYPDKKIFVATKPLYFEVFAPFVGNLIDCVMEWHPCMDSELLIEKEVLICYNVTVLTQKFLSYTHNSSDRTDIDFKLK